MRGYRLAASGLLTGSLAAGTWGVGTCARIAICHLGHRTQRFVTADSSPERHVQSPPGDPCPSRICGMGLASHEIRSFDGHDWLRREAGASEERRNRPKRQGSADCVFMQRRGVWCRL
ncbi:hypothetical protein ACQKWADRAFT_294582, partial [Trichoderma austrokoningii]